jgi:hypothetical protein
MERHKRKIIFKIKFNKMKGINLQKEAEEYAKNTADYSHKDDSGDKVYYDYYIEKALVDFVINSKHVQAKVLQAQIDVLKNIKIAISDKNPFTLYNVAHKIHELQQQLKQLENGN